MWTIIKIEKKSLSLLKQDIKKKLNDKVLFYSPKILIENGINKSFKEFEILGNYIFCYNINFAEEKNIHKIKFSRGLKYVLGGYKNSQNEILSFIQNCKNNENKDGYLNQNIFEHKINKFYKIGSGPFLGEIIKILDIQKNKIDFLLGKIKTTIKKDKIVLRPVY